MNNHALSAFIAVLAALALLATPHAYRSNQKRSPAASDFVQTIGISSDQLPERVVIKTPTASFNRYYYFALKDGKIWFKPNTETTGRVDEWKLWGIDGLPYGPKPDIKLPFDRPAAIVQIHADADELAVISDDSRVFVYVKMGGSGWNDKEGWEDKWGWPTLAAHQLSDHKLTSARAWAIGRRNADVLWQEDVDGNPHHWGTQGITTFYFLTGNGQEIHFTDSGLPADFSHRLCGPGRGSFVAENLSNSASTSFVINRRGEMFTRLYDFDTSGSDPMFFKYSYKRDSRHEDGSKWNSNFTVWSLPAEEWRRQPLIPIQPGTQARITKDITILQNGHGNSARELRVAGTDSTGATGYYTKAIFDKDWKFVQVPLAIAPEHFLIQDERSVPEAQSRDLYYAGRMKIGSKTQPFKLELMDFNLDCSPARLRITTQDGASADLTLHTAEAWTYMTRQDPGRDGTPKVFLGTLEIPQQVLDSATHDLGNVLKKYFLKHNLKLYRFQITATQQDVEIVPRAFFRRTSLSFHRANSGAFDRRDLSRSIALTDPVTDPVDDGFTYLAEADSLKMPNLESLTKDDIPTLQDRIARNADLERQLEQLIKTLKKQKGNLEEITFTADVAKALVDITGLVFLEKPKFKTASFGAPMMLHAYRDAFRLVYFRQKKDFERAKGIISRRLASYQDHLEDLMSAPGPNKRRQRIQLYFDSPSEYLDFLGLGAIAEHSVCSMRSTPCAARLVIKPVTQRRSERQNDLVLRMSCEDSGELSLRLSIDNLEEVMSNWNAPPTPEHPARFDVTISRAWEFENDDKSIGGFADEMADRIFGADEQVAGALMYDGKTFELFDTDGINRNQLDLMVGRGCVR